MPICPKTINGRVQNVFSWILATGTPNTSSDKSPHLPHGVLHSLVEVDESLHQLLLIIIGEIYDEGILTFLGLTLLVLPEEELRLLVGLLLRQNSSAVWAALDSMSTVDVDPGFVTAGTPKFGFRVGLETN